MAEEVELNVFARDVANGSKEARLALAQQLKNAGLWTGKVSADFTTKYYTALVKLDAKFKEQVALNKIVGTPAPTTRYAVLTSLREEGDGTGSTGPTTTRQTYVTSKTQTSKLLDTIAEDLLQRKMTAAEKAKYLKIINAEQKRQPSVQTSGKGFSSTVGGVDEEQLVREKIAGTAEAKTVQASDAYAIMMEELGGLR